jgi:hypothetical protein
VGTCAKEVWFGLYATHGSEELRVSRRVVEPRVEIGQVPGRTLDPEETHHIQTRLSCLFPQLTRQMEVGGGEPSGPRRGIAAGEQLPRPQVLQAPLGGTW